MDDLGSYDGSIELSIWMDELFGDGRTERMNMSKYTEEFKRNAIELMKKASITKACKELNISHCTLYRWRKEI